MKARLDELLFTRGLAETRSQARGLIMAGEVFVDDECVTKPGTLILMEANLRVRTPPRFVSRGGLKLEGAIQQFGIEVRDLVCADIGASTGGFTDCLLQHGAKRVYAIDVGYGQMHWRLQTDERVIRLDRQNFRSMDLFLIPDAIDFLVADVSFISLREIIPNAVNLLRRSKSFKGAVFLIKPQFEVGRENIGKGGIVRNESAVAMAVQRIEEILQREFQSVQTVKSPVTGADGNQEYLCYVKDFLAQ